MLHCTPIFPCSLWSSTRTSRPKLRWLIPSCTKILLRYFFVVWILCLLCFCRPLFVALFDIGEVIVQEDERFWSDLYAVWLVINISVFISLHFNGHFPSGPGLANTRMSPFSILLELRVMEVVIANGAIRHAKLQSKCHHQQTDTQSFSQAGCLSCRPTNSVKALKGKTTSRHWRELFGMCFTVSVKK